MTEGHRTNRGPRSWALVFPLLLFACAGASFAAQFPVKPVRLITPYPPGGGTDAVARPVAASFARAWGQPIVVDNRGGGGGVIAAQMVANAPPDGYTLFLSTGAVMVSAPLIMSPVAFDPYKDFRPVGLATVLPAILVAQASFPGSSVQDVIALARTRPGKLSFSSSGTGGGHHFAVEMLKAMTGVDVTHVPYRGGGPAITGLLGGEVQFCFGNIPAARPHLTSGRLKALAVASAKRTAMLPNVPTLVESGLPDFVYQTWYGFFVPGRTPRPLVDFINAELHRALADRSISESLLAQGAEVAPSTPEELGRLMREEHTRWANVIKSQNLKF